MKTTRILQCLALALVMLATVTGCGTGEGSAKYTPEDSIANLVAQKLIDTRQFVLTAQTLTLGNSRLLTVTESNNFIYVDGDKCTIQMAPNIGIAGPLTATGAINGYQVTKTKKGDTHIRFNFRGRYSSGDVSITMYRHSTNALAQINASFWRGRATMRGAIKPIKAAVIELPKPQ